MVAVNDTQALHAALLELDAMILRRGDATAWVQLFKELISAVHAFDVNTPREVVENLTLGRAVRDAANRYQSASRVPDSA